jgi:hypothetical protein
MAGAIWRTPLTSMRLGHQLDSQFLEFTLFAGALAAQNTYGSNEWITNRPLSCSRPRIRHAFGRQGLSWPRGQQAADKLARAAEAQRRLAQD